MEKKRNQIARAGQSNSDKKNNQGELATTTTKRSSRQIFIYTNVFFFVQINNCRRFK